MFGEQILNEDYECFDFPDTEVQIFAAGPEYNELLAIFQIKFWPGDNSQKIFDISDGR